MKDRQIGKFSPFEYLLKKDEKICGEYQIPARDFYKLTNNRREAKTLAWGRIISRSSEYGAQFGASLMTYGLSEKGSALLYGTGATLYAGGSLIQSTVNNMCGIIWSRNLRSILNNLDPHMDALKAELTERKIPKEEINNIHNLSNDSYILELNEFKTHLAGRRLKPALQTIATFSYGAPLFVSGLNAIGNLYSPIAKGVYYLSDVRRKARSKRARSAKDIEEQKRLDKAHIITTFATNFLTHSPKIATALAYPFLREGSDIAANLHSTTDSMGVFGGILSYQRKEEQSKRLTGIGKNMINILSSGMFLHNDYEYEKHVSQHGIKKLEKIEHHNALVFDNFKASIHGKELELPVLNITIPEGGVLLIKTPNGSGKSVTVANMMHWEGEHTGDIHIIENRNVKNIHEYKNPGDIEKHFGLYKRDHLRQGGKIVDLFRDIFYEKNQDLFEKHLKKHKNNQADVSLAWKIEDNLLQEDIDALKNPPNHLTNMFTLKKKVSSFPKKMLQTLEEISEKRKAFTEKQLNIFRTAGLVNDNIFPDRPIAKVSDGELTKIMFATAYTSDKKYLFFDEPLAGLDEKSQSFILKKMAELQEQGRILVLIAHQDTEFILKKLSNCQIISSEEKVTRVRRHRSYKPEFYKTTNV